MMGKVWNEPHVEFAAIARERERGFSFCKLNRGCRVCAVCFGCAQTCASASLCVCVRSGSLGYEMENIHILARRISDMRVLSE